MFYNDWYYVCLCAMSKARTYSVSTLDEIIYVRLKEDILYVCQKMELSDGREGMDMSIDAIPLL